MTQPIIEIHEISKHYCLGSIGIGSLRNEFQRIWPWNLDKSAAEKVFYALKDVSFEVYPGEIVGLIGRNGAGKSTLLKLLSRITEPSRGEIKLRGRVGSLLEVGTGFHPELSGRDNIFLNGAILGMSRLEIRRKFDEIVEFSEVEKFIDTPVKRYSSGMYVRLAFAVAAHLEPEILIVDEVLAVGDVQFQQKCLGKMRDVSNREGRTVLLVSHTMPVILQLAHRCVVLEKGGVSFVGVPEKAIDVYLNGAGGKSSVIFDVENTPRKVIGTLAAKIVNMRFPRALPIFEAHENIEFVLKIRARDQIKNARVSMVVFSNDGTPLGACFSRGILCVGCGEETDVHVTFSNPGLAPGSYYCGVAIGRGDYKTGHVDFDVVLETLNFDVCAAPGEETAISHWCHQWGRIVFKDLSIRWSDSQYHQSV